MERGEGGGEERREDLREKKENTGIEGENGHDHDYVFADECHREWLLNRLLPPKGD